MAMTGGTGFVGQALIEKLLRCCPDIKQILIFIRQKKGVEPKERLEALWNQKLFDDIRSRSPELFKKLKCIPCDFGEINLGISKSMQNYLEEEVNIFLHCAATLRFNENIRSSFETNVQVTRKIVDFCKQMKNLNALIHMSTAFANCNLDVCEEKIYKVDTNYKDLEHSLEWMNDEAVDLILPHVLGERPNNYTLTKAMAEDALAEKCDGIPCCIVRPAMIVAAHKEPEPGWITNVYGPTALIAAYMKGLGRHILCHQTKSCEIVPVDFVVNITLAAGMKTAVDWMKQSHLFSRDDLLNGDYKVEHVSKPLSPIPVYHCIIGEDNPLKIIQFYEGIVYWNNQQPAIPILPLSNGKSSTQAMFAVRVFLTQTVPSYILDFLLRCLGQKPRFVIINQKLVSGLDVLAYFFTKKFTFKRDATDELFRCLAVEDKKTYNFDGNVINWSEYLQNYCKGVRKNILKEHDDDVRYARRKLFWFQTSLSFAKKLVSFGVCVSLFGNYDSHNLSWRSALTYT